MINRVHSKLSMFKIFGHATLCSLVWSAEIIQYFFRVFPYTYFFVAVSVGLSLEEDSLKTLSTLWGQGVLMKIFTVSLQVNIAWVAFIKCLLPALLQALHRK